MYGYELARHGGGKAYTWGSTVVTHRSGVHLRLVNVGPTALTSTGRLGYSFRQATKLVNALFDIMTRALERGEQVESREARFRWKNWKGNLGQS